MSMHPFQPVADFAEFLHRRRRNIWSKDVEAVQTASLKMCLEQIEGSDYARDHNLSSQMSVEQFRDVVPVQPYESLQPYIQRVMDGEPSALFSDGVEIKMFATSSGTTGPRKIIPVTGKSTEILQRSWHDWGRSFYQQHVDLASTPILSMSSGWQHFKTQQGIYCGDLSGYVREVQPWFTKKWAIVPLSIDSVTDERRKYYLWLRLSLASLREVRFIATATPSTLVSIANWGDDWKELLIRDIYDGTLTSELEFTPSERQTHQSLIKKKRRKRAQELEQLASKHGALLPKYYWPKLKLIALWTGGGVGHYRNKITQLYGDVIWRDVGLASSEGCYSVPLQDETSSGYLAVTGYFFEFVHADDYEKENPPTKLAHQLVDGEQYYLVVTAANGLVRYQTNDLVCCTHKSGQLPFISFLNKAAHISDMTGEKLSNYQVSDAVKAAQEKFSIEIGDFCVIPEREPCARYRLLMDASFSKYEKMENFIKYIDHLLEERNLIYEEHREANKLAPLSHGFLRSGAFGDLRDAALKKSGASLEQYKAPCLQSDHEAAQKILEYEI